MPPSDVNLHRVTSIDDALEIKRWLGERRPVLGIDTETGGFNWWRQELRYVQLGDGMTGWAIPFQDWRGLVRELIGNYREPICFHNYKFDVQYLERNSIPVPRHALHDTEVMVHLDDTSKAKALKMAATRMVDPGFNAGQRLLEETMAKEGWGWDTIPLDYPQYWAYAALDPVMTARIWEQLAPTWMDTRIYQVEMRTTEILLQMERRGVRVDLDYCATAADRCRSYANELRAWAGGLGFKNFTSDKEFRSYLLARGWEPDVFTDGGEPSCAKEVLQRAAIDHPDLAPVINARIDCKHYEKMAGTYLESFMDLVDGEFVHPSIHVLGTRTGRMSITAPALQTLPRNDPLVRDAFIARVGNRLILCDYDQIEMRLMTHYAQSPAMIEAFKTEADIFTWMGQQIYQDPTITKADLIRDTTKQASYAKIYGAGVEKFSTTAGISIPAGTEFLGMYDSRFPEIGQFMNLVTSTARERRDGEGVAYVVSPLGRRHVLGDRDGLYKLINYLIQGTAADVLKEKIVELDAAGLGEYLVLPVHDELDLDVPTELVPEVQRTIQEVMPDTRWSVPITVGMDVVDRWGDKYR